MAGSPPVRAGGETTLRQRFLRTGELLLCEMCTRNHRSELGGSHISREVIESAIGVHPQVFRIDKGGHTLDRLGDFLRSPTRWVWTSTAPTPSALSRGKSRSAARSSTPSEAKAITTTSTLAPWITGRIAADSAGKMRMPTCAAGSGL